ncbi:DUF4199 domain-containing protein [Pseudochryseolinea flava]|uniref:DUF4199 domain-containing protein n=1 Tax=Pseudochryseolinea flava TaxID=2059302 RepID=A0A364XZQ6_9BACT|nr:DUF4199 domain-containing protein [Pseudochryseolinea flava]RAV99864.1 hypothetical protein DQQ10_17645 [Pseudochryseolinea flava]
MKRSPLVMTGLRAGAVAGLLTLALMIGLFYMNRHPLLMAPYLDFRIIVFGVFIFFAQKEFRDYIQEGVLYFWQGMMIALICFTVANIISALGMQIFGLLEKTFVTVYVEQMRSYLSTFPEQEVKRIGKEVFDSNFKALSSTNVFDLTISFFAKGTFIGLFVSVIVSIILRKQPKP